MPSEMPGQRIKYFTVEDVIAIAPSGATEACIEGGWCGFDLADSDRWSQHAVEGPAQSFRLKMRRIRVKRHDLATGMDSGVGASGAGDCDRVAQHLRQRVFKTCACTVTTSGLRANPWNGAPS